MWDLHENKAGRDGRIVVSRLSFHSFYVFPPFFKKLGLLLLLSHPSLFESFTPRFVLAILKWSLVESKRAGERSPKTPFQYS